MPISLFRNLVGDSRPAFSLNDENIVDFLKGGKDAHYVSADEALHNSDIFSLIMQLSGDLALVRYTADTDRAQSLIDNPSSTANGFSFWQSMFAQLLLDGNCYAYRYRNVNGVDLRWEYLRPSQVEPYLTEDGESMVYTIDFDEPEMGVVEDVPATDLIHIRLMSKTGGMIGISPLTALANELSIKNASNSLTLRALNQSVTANAILKVQHGGLLNAKMKADASRQLKKQIDDSDGGPVVIDALEDYQPLEVKSNVAALLNQVDWTASQIAKVYGIPNSYLNGQGDQQSSITQIGGQYAKALNRYVQPIISELNTKLNAHISADIRTAIDALGDNYATTISGLSKDGTITGNQARFVLQQSGYLPDDLPVAEKAPAPVIVQQSQSQNSSNDDNSVDDDDGDDADPTEGGDDDANN